MKASHGMPIPTLLVVGQNPLARMGIIESGDVFNLPKFQPEATMRVVSASRSGTLAVLVTVWRGEVDAIRTTR